MPSHNTPWLHKLHVMRRYWGVKFQLHSYFTSALDVGEVSDSRSCCFTPGRETLSHTPIPSNRPTIRRFSTLSLVIALTELSGRELKSHYT